MKKTIIFVIIIIVSLTGCNDLNGTDKIDEIDFADDFGKQPVKLFLSELADNVEYIQLQSDSLSLLSRFKNDDVKFLEGFTLIKDSRNSLILFDSIGGFVSKIGEVGKGPGEFTEITDFTILPKDSLIVINSRLDKKFLFFNYKGEFKGEKNIGFQTEDLFVFKNNIVSVNSFPFRSYSDFFNLNVFDKNGELIKRVKFKSDEKSLQKRLNNRVFWSFQSGSRMFYPTKNSFLYWENGLYDFRDTLWQINESFKIEPKMVFNIGGKKPNLESFYEDYNFINDKDEYYSSIEGFVETKDYSFFKVFSEELKKIHYFFVDKKNERRVNLKYKNPTGSGVIFAFANDIDGSVPFWPDGMVSEDKVFKILYGYDVRNYLEERKDSGVVKDTLKLKELENLVKDARITDNPILMIVTLK